jgi:hypothetical protein
MKVTYDPSVDAAYIQITSSKGGVETALADDHVAVDIDFEMYGESTAHNLKPDTAAVREEDARCDHTGSE